MHIATLGLLCVKKWGDFGMTAPSAGNLGDMSPCPAPGGYATAAEIRLLIVTQHSAAITLQLATIKIATSLVDDDDNDDNDD